MRRDLAHAIRLLWHSKGWTAIVLISLALGIGANTALFTAVNGLLLQALPVASPDTLVRLKWAGKNDMMRSSSEYGFSLPDAGRDVRATFSYAVYQQLRASNKTLTDLIACAPIGPFNVVVNGEAELASAFGVTGNYHHLLGVPALHGRTLIEEDDKPGAPGVAVISHAFWRKRFGSDPAVVNRIVTINNQPVTIVGVTPADFTSIQYLGNPAPDVTVPLSLDPIFNVGLTPRLTTPTTWWIHILGRLRPGANYDQVRGNFEGVFQQTARAGMDEYMTSLTTEQRSLSTNQRPRTAVPPLLVSSAAHGIYDLDRNSRRSASFLTVVVILVLLIVCANVANLLLSRATARQREISIRLSVGATRTRLIRQLVTESLLLSFTGGVLGLLVGYWSRQLLPFGQDVPIDWRVFAFVAGVSVLTGIIFGLAPAFRATRVDLAETMKESSRSVIGSRTLLGRALLVVQVAVSLVLIVGAGLFLQTLSNLRAADVGFDPGNLLMFQVNPQLNRYDADRSAALYRQIQDALAALPAVRKVAITRTALLSGSRSTSTMFIQGGTKEQELHMMTVSPAFFETMGIPVLLGRGFADSDVATSPRVAIVNEAAMRTLFQGTSPVGRRLGYPIEKSGDIEIVGVIHDTKYASVRDAAPPTMYQSVQQGPLRGNVWFVLRTGADPDSLIPSVRAAVRAIDPALPLTNMTTQTEQVEKRFAQERLFALAYSLFGGLALLLACIGLFGLMSYNVSRRTNEIGIRMALGAQRPAVARMILGESLLLVAIGAIIGLVAVFLAGRLVATVLFGLAPTDPVTIGSAIAVIVLVSMLAGYVPARRASRVDPLIALHRQ